ncbi:bifunctional pyr operon transcriptional regulator/uracil phosphoribosyltransferase PyrR [Polynucleobacter rarus]|uniref:bifunctional pyr operon transcriptional regulator/uracil phosphoribosyltransferase PyrR n=1 Tax=Polynucleobacter rarus TaxID=556055 RepID=UPI000D3E5AAA|nr:bifunctional pyr operon transcriptional regulator/uracil phosphoribosyltransferase PyrR [Polynucleobacter rarus]
MTANIPDEIPSSLPDAEKLYTHLLGLLKEAQIKNPNLQLAGLASGGVWVAQRLAKDLGLSSYGVVNVSFHRDDYSAKGTSAINSSEGMSTNLPFSVEGAHVVLVDDVLDTGRTVRAALNELFDFGRPAKVELAVLADRYRRELPVEASYRGAKVLDLGDNQRLVLSMLSNGKLDFNTERKVPA